MATAREIKRRITSVKNTKKITRAMELVSAAKMRRAVSSAVESRPYSKELEQLVSYSQKAVQEEHLQNPLIAGFADGTDHIAVLVTSDRGLCGAYNSRVIEKALQFAKKVSDEGKKIGFICIGKKGRDIIARSEYELISSFTYDEYGTDLYVWAVAQSIKNAFIQKRAERVSLFSTDYKNSLIQLPFRKNLLPLQKMKTSEDISEELPEDIDINAMLFEPHVEAVVETLAVRYIVGITAFALREAVASEHAARMIAMKNATDAANDMQNALKLEYNKARQAGITQEISEIAAGANSVT